MRSIVIGNDLNISSVLLARKWLHSRLFKWNWQKSIEPNTVDCVVLFLSLFYFFISCAFHFVFYVTFIRLCQTSFQLCAFYVFRWSNVCCCGDSFWIDVSHRLHWMWRQEKKVNEKQSKRERMKKSVKNQS